MTIVLWQSEYDTGYAEVDAQHQKLVNLINQLINGVSQGKSKEALRKILQELFDDTYSHFKHEQNMMAKLTYSGFLDHRASHDVLKYELIDFLARFDDDPSFLTLETIELLKQSLIEHIVQKDIPMTKDLKALESELLVKK